MKKVFISSDNINEFNKKSSKTDKLKSENSSSKNSGNVSPNPISDKLFKKDIKLSDVPLNVEVNKKSGSSTPLIKSDKKSGSSTPNPINDKLFKKEEILNTDDEKLNTDTKYSWDLSGIENRLKNTIDLPSYLWEMLKNGDIVCFKMKDGTFNGSYNRVVGKYRVNYETIGVIFSFYSKENKERINWVLKFELVSKLYIQKTLWYEISLITNKKILLEINNIKKDIAKLKN
jgi:hypothetical protein